MLPKEYANETPLSLANSFSRELLDEIPEDKHSSPIVKACLVSCRVAAESVFICMLRGDLPPEKVFVLLGQMKVQYKLFWAQL